MKPPLNMVWAAFFVVGSASCCCTCRSKSAAKATVSEPVIVARPRSTSTSRSRSTVSDRKDQARQALTGGKRSNAEGQIQAATRSAVERCLGVHVEISGLRPSLAPVAMQPHVIVAVDGKSAWTFALQNFGMSAERSIPLASNRCSRVDLPRITSGRPRLVFGRLPPPNCHGSPEARGDRDGLRPVAHLKNCASQE